MKHLPDLVAAHKIVRHKINWSFNQNVYIPGCGIVPVANKKDQGYKILRRVELHIEGQIREIRMEGRE
jgi:hypothetical protein